MILAPAIPDSAASAGLPQNHPPLEASEAISALVEATARDPQNADLKVRLANAYYDAGLYSEAVQAYEAAMTLKAQGPEVETDLATCYHYIGQHERALAMLDKVLASNPGFAQALFNKGVVLQAGKNDSQGAIAAWEELLRTNPNHPQRSVLERKIRDLRSAAK